MSAISILRDIIPPEAWPDGKLQKRHFENVIEFPDGSQKIYKHYLWPKQLLAATTPVRNILYGGAVGPGKSHWLMRHVLTAALKWPGIPILVMRRDLKDIKNSTEVEWRKVCPPELYDPRWGGQHHQTEHWYKLFNTSRVYFGEGKDWESYKSMEVGMEAFDELTEFEEDFYDNMGSRLRWTSGEGVCDRKSCGEIDEAFRREHPRHPFYQRIAASNPAPGWVKQRWWDPWNEGKEKANYIYIPSTTLDNPDLPPDYIVSLLEDHNVEWVKNYVLGDWRNFEGMVFDNWNRATHSWRREDALPAFERVIGGIDYGASGENAHRTCAYLTGVTRDGWGLTFWEYSKQGEASNDFFESIVHANRQYDVERWDADSSQSRANELLRQELGVPVRDAPRYQGAREDGTALMKRLLDPQIRPRGGSTGPMWMIHERCTHLIDSMETYTGKRVRDDELDAARYNVMAAFKGFKRFIDRDVIPTQQGGTEPSKRLPSSILTHRRDERRARIERVLERWGERV